ncbi:MAG: ABC transporter permease [Christensenellaceae bacterium]|nr:ABC transporter permease [Christensenellaceae bacterium]
MGKFIVKRLLTSVLILICVMLIIYTLMHCLPTNYIETMARQLSQRPGNTKSAAEWLADLNAQYGMDKGIIGGFFVWLQNALAGDFGVSWVHNVPPTEKFMDVIGVSFILGAISMIFEIIIAIPLGILAAKKQYSGIDYFVTVFAMICISMPTFFVATLLKLVFGVQLGWFEIAGLTSARFFDTLSPMGQFWNMAWHLVLPVITIVIISIGGLMRYTRTNMLEVMNADYIRTARAKGLPEKVVINKHAFRNTLIPVVTILGGSLPSLFSGALITEQLFSIPGIGYTAYQSMIVGDIPFTMFYLTFMAILTLVGNLIADLLYAAVDPRVRLS